MLALQSAGTTWSSSLLSDDAFGVDRDVERHRKGHLSAQTGRLTSLKLVEGGVVAALGGVAVAHHDLQNPALRLLGVPPDRQPRTALIGTLLHQRAHLEPRRSPCPPLGLGQLAHEKFFNRAHWHEVAPKVVEQGIELFRTLVGQNGVAG